MEELKRRIKKSGIERKKLAELIDVTYGTLNIYLNEFAIMPDHVREKIERVLVENE